MEIEIKEDTLSFIVKDNKTHLTSSEKSIFLMKLDQFEELHDLVLCVKISNQGEVYILKCHIPQSFRNKGEASFLFRFVSHVSYDIIFFNLVQSLLSCSLGQHFITFYKTNKTKHTHTHTRTPHKNTTIPTNKTKQREAKVNKPSSCFYLKVVSH